MATDLKTTSERVQILKNAAKSLERMAQLCQDTQRYHDDCSDFLHRAENVDARMAAVKAGILSISNELSELASDENMEFQYDWTAGRSGVYEIYVSSQDSNVRARYEGGANIRSAFTNALSATDVIRLVGSAYTSQQLTVVSMSTTGTEAYVNGLGGTESRLARVIKELKG